VVAVLAVLVAGCSGAGPSPGSATTFPTASGQPRTEAAARGVVQQWFDRLTTGDFAGAWLLYTDEGQAAVSQADYITLNATCPSLRGTQFTIVSGRVNGDTADEQVNVGNLVNSYALAYEHGEWRIEPTSTDLVSRDSGSVMPDVSLNRYEPG
jgi:hypothetical protein